MARSPYLTRRDGRYYLQIRVGSKAAPLVGISVIRMALGTCEHRTARRRLMRCLPWVLDVVDSVDFSDLFLKSMRRLDEYAASEAAADADVLHARRRFEELLKNLHRRAQAAGFDPESAVPNWLSLINWFVSENVRIEEQLREAADRQAYDRGRHDERQAAANGFGTAAAPARANGVDGLFMAFEQELGRPALPPAQPSPQAAVAAPAPLRVVQSEPNTPARDLRISEVLALYLAADLKAHGVAKATSEHAPTIRFMVEALKDPPLASVTEEQFALVDAMLPDIPAPKKIPWKVGKGLYARYAYAQTHGWEGLERLAENAIKNRYWNALRIFQNWAITNGHMPGPKYEFKELSKKLFVEQPRDAFEDFEILKLFSQPLYTGCAGLNRMWKPGEYFLQNHWYWGYLILLLTGMRSGEVAQLKLHQFVRGEDLYFFDLRPFDARKGRITREEMPQLKSSNAPRVIPIHPLLIDLGLKDRVDDLRKLGCERLLPELPIYVRTTGQPMPGHAISKSWNYIKENLDFKRADVSLYSARHWMAQVLDDGKVDRRTRARVMGHAGGDDDDVPLRYGSNRLMTKEQASFIVELETPLITKMREVLMTAKQKAEQGELKTLRPWLTPANWAK